MHMKIIAGLIFGALALSNAYAQTAETPAEGEIQTVQVTGVRDPEMMPYKDAYETLTRLNAVGQGRIEFVIRVMSKKTKQPVTGLELALRGENTFERVPVLPGGVVDVPLSEKAYADNAEFVSNQKKGTILAQMGLNPKLPPENIKYADILESLEAARRAVKVVVPWYLRLFISNPDAIGLCYPDNRQVVQITGKGESTRAANVERGHEGKLYCARFARGEKELDKESTIVAPAGWQAKFM